MVPLNPHPCGFQQWPLVFLKTQSVLYNRRLAEVLAGNNCSCWNVSITETLNAFA